MAAQSWKIFFKSIDKYFFDRKSKIAKQDFHWGRLFLVTHFCGYDPSALVEAQRTIYIAEGDRALIQANLMEEAYHNLHESADFQFYLLRKDEESLLRMVALAVKNCPKLGVSESVCDSIRAYLTERIAWEWMNKYSTALYKAYKTSKSEFDRQELMSVIIANNPHIANGIKTDAEKIIKNYLAQRIAWEAINPGKEFVKPYVSPDTTYYGITFARSKLSSPIRPTRTHYDSPRSTAKSLVSIHEEKTAAMRNLPMPTFTEVVGKRKFLWIPYWIDALGTFLFHYPAKGVCWLINSLCGENKKNSWWAIGLKSLLAGPFIIGKIATTSIAKIFSLSGLKEIYHLIKDDINSNQVEKIHPPLQPGNDIELSSPSPSHSPRAGATHSRIGHSLKQYAPPPSPISKRPARNSLAVDHPRSPSLNPKRFTTQLPKVEIKPQPKIRHIRKASSVPKDIHRFKIQVDAPEAPVVEMQELKRSNSMESRNT